MVDHEIEAEGPELPAVEQLQQQQQPLERDQQQQQQPPAGVELPYMARAVYRGKR